MFQLLVTLGFDPIVFFGQNTDGRGQWTDGFSGSIPSSLRTAIEATALLGRIDFGARFTLPLQD